MRTFERFLRPRTAAIAGTVCAGGGALVNAVLLTPTPIVVAYSASHEQAWFTALDTMGAFLQNVVVPLGIGLVCAAVLMRYFDLRTTRTTRIDLSSDTQGTARQLNKRDHPERP